MKKNLKRLAALLLVVLMVAAILPTAAFADGVDYSATAEIPFYIFASGCAEGANPLERKPNLKYSICLSINKSMPDVDNPLVDGPVTKEITASDLSDTFGYSGSFKVRFTKPGVYHFIVSQVRYNDESGFNDEYCDYDDVVYMVSVNVTNNDKGGLTAAVIIKNPDDPSDKDNKPSTCAFINDYFMRFTVAKKWSGISYYRPEVNVAVYKGELPKDDSQLVGAHNVSLSEANDWTFSTIIPYDYRDLENPSLGYSIKETPVPGGYFASYPDPVILHENNDENAPITGVAFQVNNYHVLIQTGQLNWPIPVLLGLGVLLIGAGVIMLSKKKKNNA
ncbi:MAG: LPXTG cell wall anchor domain-containing protein [Oscillospiraceae bacterium]|nr:LPXTG cell wall anchor domain-containing protein [Oscillospiraceae bacterium]